MAPGAERADPAALPAILPGASQGGAHGRSTPNKSRSRVSERLLAAERGAAKASGATINRELSPPRQARPHRAVPVPRTSPVSAGPGNATSARPGPPRARPRGSSDVSGTTFAARPFGTSSRLACQGSQAMKITGHRTEAVYRRYAVVSEADLREALQKLDSYIYGDSRRAALDDRRVSM